MKCVPVQLPCEVACAAACCCLLTCAFLGVQPRIAEILSTEEAYLENLEKLIQVYVQPLRQDQQRSFFHTKVLPAENFQQIFGSVEQLVPLHKMFLEALRTRVASRSAVNDNTVGDIFLKFAPFFKVLRCLSPRRCGVRRRRLMMRVVGRSTTRTATTLKSRASW